MRRYYRQLVTLGICLLAVAAVSHRASAQFTIQQSRPDLRWRGIGMEEFWRTHSAAYGSGSQVQHVIPHVSSTDHRTVFEVVVGDTRRAFVPELTDRWGRYLGESGAERQADIERRVLIAQGMPAKVEKKQIRQATLYVQTSAGVLQAIDAETGQIRWTLVVGSHDSPPSAPGVSDDAVATVDGTTLSVVSARDGTFRWSRRLNAIPAGFVGIGGDLIFVPRLRNGVELFSVQDSELPRSIMSNGFATGGLSVSPTRIAWPTSLGYVQVVNTETGETAFRIETRTPVQQPASFGADGSMCIATSDGMVIAANSENGAMRWQFMAGDLVDQSPMIFDDSVCVVTRGGDLSCLDLATGRLRWRRGGIHRWVGMSAGRILAVDIQDQLVALEPTQGNQLGASPLNGLRPLVSHVVSDRIYLTDGGGLLLALRPMGGLWPTIFAPLIEAAPTEDATVVTPAPTPPTPAEPTVPESDKPEDEEDALPPEDDPFGGGDDPFGDAPADDDPFRGDGN